MQDRLWSLKEFPFQPQKIRYYETIFAIGNGYLGTRASLEERYPGDMPTTLVHGIFNQAPDMSVPELVNVPDWTEIQLIIDGTPFKMKTESVDMLNPPDGLVLGYERKLHMDTGLLRRAVVFRATSGATVRIVFERFASLADQHVLAQRVHISAIDGKPSIEIHAKLNGDVNNDGIQHWDRMETTFNHDLMMLQSTTSQSKYQLVMASALVSPNAVTYSAEHKQTSAQTHFQLENDVEITLEKLTTIYTSRDVDDVDVAARQKLVEAAAKGFEALYTDHAACWRDAWSKSDITIDGDDDAQIGVRFATYHLLIAAPRHDNDVSIGAKTMSGLGYKGHVFWDTELFMLPPFTLTIPQIAKNMLMYRYHRLEGARRKAQDNGYKGAMFPWESTDTGIETTPQWSDPFPDGSRIRIWTGDNEQHISTDIAYATLQYWQWSGDDAFMVDYGAEMVLDTAKFWSSRVQEMNGRYELHNQIGPDEYHENINNSVFVNRMVVWHMQAALKLVDWLKSNQLDAYQRLSAQLDLRDDDLAHWRDIVERMYIPFDEAQQIHVQFDGFFDLEFIPVQKYEPRVGGIWGFLGHQRALQSQVIKQADVVMLMALLGEALAAQDILLKNWETYYPRCDHGSSLSPSIHAWVAAKVGLTDTAYQMFEHAAAIDLDDKNGNVPDGIHGAACGGLWQAIVFGFCGLHLTGEGPMLEPKLPSHWKRVVFNVNYRGKAIQLVAE